MDRVIGCLWLPQFALKVETMRHASLDGAPLALSTGGGQRPEVLECSPEAEALGVRPGMPIREALALCGGLVLVAPDPVLYTDEMERVLDRLEALTGPVEPTRLGMAFVDLGALGYAPTGGIQGQESPTSTIPEDEGLREILRAAPPHFRARLGIAQNKFTAEAAAQWARPGQVLRVEPGRERAFLAPLPARWLTTALNDADLPRGLEQQGLHTLGLLAGLLLGPVQAQFGRLGGYAWKLARGEDDQPFQPRTKAPRVEARLEFPSPVSSLEGVMAGLERLVVRVFSQPVLRGRSVDQITVRAWLADGAGGDGAGAVASSWERTFTLRDPVSSARAALTHLRGRLMNASPEGAVAQLGLALKLMNGPSVVQEELWSGRRHQLRGVAEAARQLRARFGNTPGGQLYRVVEVEPWSRFPERRWALVDCSF